RAPVAQSAELGAEQLEVAHPVELGIVRHAGGAIAEAELGAQIKIDVGAAVGGPAAECAPDTPLVERERPFELGPGDGRVLPRIPRLLPGAERHRAACEHARDAQGDHHNARAQCDHFTSTLYSSIILLARSLSAACLSAACAALRSRPLISMSKTLPWRTLATPAIPSDLSAPSIALPWGSRMPDLRVTVTRAFIGILQASIWHESVKPQATQPRTPARAAQSLGTNRFSAQGRLLIARGGARGPRHGRSRRGAAAPPRTPPACSRRPEWRAAVRAALPRPRCAARRRKSATPPPPAPGRRLWSRAR